MSLGAIRAFQTPTQGPDPNLDPGSFAADEFLSEKKGLISVHVLLNDITSSP